MKMTFALTDINNNDIEDEVAHEKRKKTPTTFLSR
jgi:hypothetical protein